jgi:ABC-type transport system involved in multi-copper enzyme maturation permease subunit
MAGSATVEDGGPAKVRSKTRAWLALIRLSAGRHVLPRQLAGISLSLLLLASLIVGLNTLNDRWSMAHWRSPRGLGPTYADWLAMVQTLPWSKEASLPVQACTGAGAAVIARGGFQVFSTWVVLSFFVSFLMPVWTLSFATDALGAESENGTLIWLLARPLSRPAIYMAKYTGMLPYTFGMCAGGFGVLCLAGGWPGRLAFQVFWPAVLMGTWAFSSLYFCMGACLQRPAIVAIVYSFFLETVLANMPGHMKRLSIGFYTRCMMFEGAAQHGFQPEKPAVYQPVSGSVAFVVLTAVVAASLFFGIWVFSYKEYRDLN